MNDVFIAYDVTRLLAHFVTPVPSGIDRIDLAYATHFFSSRNDNRIGTFLYGLKPALLDAKRLMPFLSIRTRNWRDGIPGESTSYDDVKTALLADGPPSRRSLSARARFRRTLKAAARALGPLRLLSPLTVRQTFFIDLPDNAVFIHTTHYPFEFLFHWLDRRPDIKPVFFIHDLLPLEFPEYFDPREIAWHRRSFEIFAHYGCAAIVNTKVVERKVRQFLHGRVRHDVGILTAPIPPDPAFIPTNQPDPDFSGAPYFVMCSTIEPRKNHLMLLQVWRELARRHGSRTPKLLLIGKRGWENENVVDLLERAPDVAKFVIEVADLPSSAAARLIANARALLMPSFGEGYGLPVVEARALGTAVVASDIGVFREIAPNATFVAPLDGLGWQAAIEARIEDSPRFEPALVPDGDSSSANYFARVEDFIKTL